MIQGIASNCDDPFPRGGIVGLDAATGVELKSSYFVPEDKVGGGVWTSPAVDTQRGDIFVTTGSAHAWEDGDSFSIVRLNVDTFEIEDRWKLPNVTGKFWDGDWGSSPTLFNDTKGRQLVGAGQKDGGYYAFDRDDLAAGPVWIAPIAVGGDVPQQGQGVLPPPHHRQGCRGIGLPAGQSQLCVPLGLVGQRLLQPLEVQSIPPPAESCGGTRSMVPSWRRSRLPTASFSQSAARQWPLSMPRTALSFGPST